MKKFWSGEIISGGLIITDNWTSFEATIFQGHPSKFYSHRFLCSCLLIFFSPSTKPKNVNRKFYLHRFLFSYVGSIFFLAFDRNKIINGELYLHRFSCYIDHICLRLIHVDHDVLLNLPEIAWFWKLGFNYIFQVLGWMEYYFSHNIMSLERSPQ